MQQQVSGYHILSEARSEAAGCFIAKLQIFADTGYGDARGEPLWQESKGGFESEREAHAWAVAQGENWVQGRTLH
jgi:hypothetical protein